MPTTEQIEKNVYSDNDFQLKSFPAKPKNANHKKMEHSERDDDDDDDKNGTEKLVEKEYLFLIAVGCCSLFCNSILSFFSQCITVLS